MGTFDLSNPDAFAFQQKTKPIWDKKSGLPKFSLQGSWSDTSKSGEQNTWKNTGVSFEITAKKVPNYQVSSSGIKHQVQPKGGVQTTTGYIMKDTLEKGGAQTILGMSKQEDQFGNETRGENYANPNFYAWEDSQKEAKEKEENLDKLGVLTGGLIGNDPDPEPQVNSRGVEVGYANIKKKNAMRRELAFKRSVAGLKYGDVGTANAILSDLGRPLITVYKKRPSPNSDRYTPTYTQDPLSVINDYRTKSTINAWAESVDPEHMKVDPNRTISVVDYTTPRKTYYTTDSWRRSGGQRHTLIVHDPTYKDVLATEHEKKGDKMDYKYNKVMKKAKEKKAKYETYFNTNPEVPDHKYYGVTDQDFESHESFKQGLLTEISGRRSNQKQIIDRLKLDTQTIEQKDRSGNIIPTLQTTVGTLDTKATTLKKQIGDYDWQKNISQDSFGTDTIHGESHITNVLSSYGGKVRGGGYYGQDVGKLVKRTKLYESEMESQIKQKKDLIESTEVDETEGLVDYFNDKATKESATANKEYLTKSLKLTREEREKLEQSRKAELFHSNTEATIAYKQPTPTPSRRQYRNRRTRGGKKTRTRGGKNTLGGLVI
jgi:hypothetical protein